MTSGKWDAGIEKEPKRSRDALGARDFEGRTSADFPQTQLARVTPERAPPRFSGLRLDVAGEPVCTVPQCIAFLEPWRSLLSLHPPPRACPRTRAQIKHGVLAHPATGPAPAARRLDRAMVGRALVVLLRANARKPARLELGAPVSAFSCCCLRREAEMAVAGSTSLLSPRPTGLQLSHHGTSLSPSTSATRTPDRTACSNLTLTRSSDHSPLATAQPPPPAPVPVTRQSGSSSPDAAPYRRPRPPSPSPPSSPIDDVPAYEEPAPESDYARAIERQRVALEGKSAQVTGRGALCVRCGKIGGMERLTT